MFKHVIAGRPPVSAALDRVRLRATVARTLRAPPVPAALAAAIALPTDVDRPAERLVRRTAASLWLGHRLARCKLAADRAAKQKTRGPRVQASDIEQSVDNYVLLRRMGHGSMGTVYEARHKQIERRVAIKILHKELSDDPEIIQRFTNEARIVNIIGHAGLVAISESGQTRDGSRYIVMEYVDGITLRDFVAQRGGRLPVPHVLRITRQVASTLAAAHDKQIVHRDLKPANIMLVREPSETEVGASGESASSVPEKQPERIPEKLKILDFGIAKINGEGMGQTRTGVAMGTPIYMSPEQCRSGRNAVDRSDVYALGIIAYELLAGSPPFQGGAAVLMAAHIMQEPPPLLSQAPDTPPALASLIHAMLAKSPSDRPSAAEVARKLAELSGARTTASKAYAILPGERADPADATEVLGDAALSQVGAQSALHAVPIRLRGKLLAVAALFLLLLGLLLVLLLWTLARQPVSPPASPPQRPRGGTMRPIGLVLDGSAGDGERDGGTRDAVPSSANQGGMNGGSTTGVAGSGSPSGMALPARDGDRSKRPAVKAKPKKSSKKKAKTGNSGSRHSTK